MDRRALLAVASITGAALLLRLLVLQQSLFGDELSTLYVVDGRGLSEVFSRVSSDAEISPPLYFVLAWLTTRLGEAPELVRLPALLAGVGLVPLCFLLGRRAGGETAGLFAAGFSALAPFLLFFSVTGRAYTLMMLFLVLAACCLIRAGDRGGWWWAGFGAASVLAMYSHYTAAFVLAAEFVWGLWAFPRARRQLLLTAGLAIACFVPWLNQLFADLDSPTNELLQSLQGSGLHEKLMATVRWAVGHPLVAPAELPGRIVYLVMGAAALIAAFFTLRSGAGRRGFGGWAREHPEALLVALAALATPVGLALLALAGSDLFGTRNLAASWPFLAVLAALLVAGAGRIPAVLTGAVILLGFGIGAAMTVTSHRLPDYEAAAHDIGAEAGPGDSVLDLLDSPISPVPLTPLGAEGGLRAGVRVFDLNHPTGEPPFLAFAPKADPDRLLRRALARSSDARIFVLGPEAEVTSGARARYSDGDLELPPGWRTVDRRTYPGLAELVLVTLEKSGNGRGGSGDPAAERLGSRRQGAPGTGNP